MPRVQRVAHPAAQVAAGRVLDAARVSCRLVHIHRVALRVVHERPVEPLVAHPRHLLDVAHVPVGVPPGLRRRRGALALGRGGRLLVAAGEELVLVARGGRLALVAIGHLPVALQVARRVVPQARGAARVVVSHVHPVHHVTRRAPHHHPRVLQLAHRVVAVVAVLVLRRLAFRAAHHERIRVHHPPRSVVVVRLQLRGARVVLQPVQRVVVVEVGFLIVVVLAPHEHDVLHPVARQIEFVVVRLQRAGTVRLHAALLPVHRVVAVRRRAGVNHLLVRIRLSVLRPRVGVRAHRVDHVRRHLRAVARQVVGDAHVRPTVEHRPQPPLRVVHQVVVLVHHVLQHPRGQHRLLRHLLAHPVARQVVAVARRLAQAVVADLDQLARSVVAVVEVLARGIALVRERARAVVGIAVVHRAAAALRFRAPDQVPEQVVSPGLVHARRIALAHLAAQRVVAVAHHIGQRARHRVRIGLRCHASRRRIARLLPAQHHVARAVIAVARGLLVAVDHPHLAPRLVVLVALEHAHRLRRAHRHPAATVHVRCQLHRLAVHAVHPVAQRIALRQRGLRQPREPVVRVVRHHRAARAGIHQFGRGHLVAEGIEGVVHPASVGMTLLHHVARQVAHLGVHVPVGIPQAHLPAQRVVVDARARPRLREVRVLVQPPLLHHLVVRVVAQRGRAHLRALAHALRLVDRGHIAPAVVFAGRDRAAAQVVLRRSLRAQWRQDRRPARARGRHPDLHVGARDVRLLRVRHRVLHLHLDPVGRARLESIQHEPLQRGPARELRAPVALAEQIRRGVASRDHRRGRDRHPRTGLLLRPLQHVVAAAIDDRLAQPHPGQPGRGRHRRLEHEGRGHLVLERGGQVIPHALVAERVAVVHRVQRLRARHRHLGDVAVALVCVLVPAVTVPDEAGVLARIAIQPHEVPHVRGVRGQAEHRVAAVDILVQPLAGARSRHVHVAEVALVASHRPLCHEPLHLRDHVLVRGHDVVVVALVGEVVALQRLAPRARVCPHVAHDAQVVHVVVVQRHWRRDVAQAQTLQRRGAIDVEREGARAHLPHLAALGVGDAVFIGARLQAQLVQLDAVRRAEGALIGAVQRPGFPLRTARAAGLDAQAAHHVLRQADFQALRRDGPIEHRRAADAAAAGAAALGTDRTGAAPGGPGLCLRLRLCLLLRWRQAPQEGVALAERRGVEPVLPLGISAGRAVVLQRMERGHALLRHGGRIGAGAAHVAVDAAVFPTAGQQLAALGFAARIDRDVRARLAQPVERRQARCRCARDIARDAFVEPAGALVQQGFAVGRAGAEEVRVAGIVVVAVDGLAALARFAPDVARAGDLAPGELGGVACGRHLVERGPVAEDVEFFDLDLLDGTDAQGIAAHRGLVGLPFEGIAGDGFLRAHHGADGGRLRFGGHVPAGVVVPGCLVVQRDAHIAAAQVLQGTPHQVHLVVGLAVLGARVAD
ncbi:hypothetical protein ACAN107058_21425 [Paracidovorax anthurii]